MKLPKHCLYTKHSRETTVSILIKHEWHATRVPYDTPITSSLLSSVIIIIITIIIESTSILAGVEGFPTTPLHCSAWHWTTSFLLIANLRTLSFLHSNQVFLILPMSPSTAKALHWHNLQQCFFVRQFAMYKPSQSTTLHHISNWNNSHKTQQVLRAENRPQPVDFLASKERATSYTHTDQRSVQIIIASRVSTQLELVLTGSI